MKIEVDNKVPLALLMLCAARYGLDMQWTDGDLRLAPTEDASRRAAGEARLRADWTAVRGAAGAEQITLGGVR